MTSLRLLALSAFFLAGCPEAASSPAPSEPAACEHIGDRCQLPEGPIGVCNVTTTPCDDPPCLACISQH